MPNPNLMFIASKQHTLCYCASKLYLYWNNIQHVGKMVCKMLARYSIFGAHQRAEEAMTNPVTLLQFTRTSTGFSKLRLHRDAYYAEQISLQCWIANNCSLLR